MQQGPQGNRIEAVEGQFENATKQQFLAYLNTHARFLCVYGVVSMRAETTT